MATFFPQQSPNFFVPQQAWNGVSRYPPIPRNFTSPSILLSQLVPRFFIPQPLFHSDKTSTSILQNDMMIWCKWKSPCLGFVAINCDGSYQRFRNCAGFEVILRDYRGQVIMAKANHHQEDSSSEVSYDTMVLMQEMLAIRDGFRLAKNVHCTHVEVQSDSKNAISMIDGDIPCPKECLHILHEIKMECDFFKMVYFLFVYRESNQAADFLSKFLRNEGEKYFDLSELPEELSKIVWEDVYGSPVVRQKSLIARDLKS